MAERYWLDETDPRELERRADDLASSGLWAMADMLKERARALRQAQQNEHV